ncbi:type VI-A CRISPR-associated RNA-guided ribonuclease Cas13a [Pseudahrensia aquimaris]|uniref:CRISPR-associated endoribonuclease Cas13a n=1 Tax=Pseudahrensia aquimaris TaxID=744461 RepID=A0ABW3FDK8_9HYPH
MKTRTVGSTYTIIEDTSLRRGVELKSKEEPSNRLLPQQVVEKFAEDPEWVLREAISVLDKTVKKRRRLADLSVQAYELRALLGEQLWTSVVTPLIAEAGEEVDEKRLRDRWMQRVHPYAEHKVNSKDFTQDENHLSLKKKGGEETDAVGVLQKEFQGRWFEAFWSDNGSTDSDIAQVAKRIKEHLLEQEIQQNGQDRLKSEGQRLASGEIQRSPTGVGLIERRLIDLTGSAHDPRQSKRHDSKLTDGHAGQIEVYFKRDIALQIYNELRTLNSYDGQPDAAFFGSRFHAHLNLVGATSKSTDPEKLKKRWDVHNAVRQHYAKIARSAKFRRLRKELAEASDEAAGVDSERASNDEEKAKAKHRDKALARFLRLFPENGEKLLKIIKAKERNRDISQIIRLGKLVVHACDLPLPDKSLDQEKRNEALNEIFQARMDYLATSDGQAEIRRHEIFTRLFRNSVSLSHRTLSVLATANHEKPPRFKWESGFWDYDIASQEVKQAAYSKKSPYFCSEHYSRQVKLIFGNGTTPATGQQSRAQIMGCDGEPGFQKQIGGDLTELLGRIRNRTTHFSTLPRLAGLITETLLADQSKNSRRAFARLLEFDQKLRIQALVDDLNRIDASIFLTKLDLELVISQLGKSIAAESAPLPRYTSVIRRLNKLHENEDERLRLEGVAALLGALNFNDQEDDNDEDSKAKANRFKLDLLRLLYNSGFGSWLDGEDGKKAVQNTLDEVVKQKKRRTEIYKQEQGWIHKHADDLLDNFGIGRDWSLNEIFRQLSARAAREEGQDKSYGVKSGDQSALANRLERFRQELYGHLFATYLDQQELDGVLGVEELREVKGGDARKIEFRQVEEAMPKTEKPEAWHPQIYAWLYTVPMEEVARLRHQIRKTRILDDKGKSESKEGITRTLNQLDDLMGLYVAAQGAGFDGTEHLVTKGAADLTPILNQMCFDSDVDFVALAGDEDDEQTYAGVRRGLRQILRFGNDSVLKKVFEKHRVSSTEVNNVVASRAKDATNLSEAARAARETFLEEWKVHRESKSKPKSERDRSEARLVALAKQVSEAKTSAQILEFQTRAARLGEHARVHDIMIRVIARLMDFAGVWERDMMFIWAGLFYLQEQPNGGLQLELEFDEERNDDLVTLRCGAGHVPVWTRKQGFANPSEDSRIAALSVDLAKQYDMYAGTRAVNRKDIKANQRLKRNSKNPRPLAKHDPRQIRNDLAHYNVISNILYGQNVLKDGSRKLRRPAIWSLSYVVNAVRSLFSYDRKMKNAVSGSIIRILEREGFGLRWSMRDDRLQHAKVIPLLEMHLSMAGRLAGTSAAFQVPRHSPRMVSMVQALFQMDDGGNRMPKTVNGEVKRSGAISYPFEDMENASQLPPAFVLMQYDEL